MFCPFIFGGSHLVCQRYLLCASGALLCCVHQRVELNTEAAEELFGDFGFRRKRTRKHAGGACLCRLIDNQQADRILHGTCLMPVPYKMKTKQK